MVLSCYCWMGKNTTRKEVQTMVDREALLRRNAALDREIAETLAEIAKQLEIHERLLTLMRNSHKTRKHGKK